MSSRQIIQLSGTRERLQSGTSSTAPSLVKLCHSWPNTSKQTTTKKSRWWMLSFMAENEKPKQVQAETRNMIKKINFSLRNAFILWSITIYSKPFGTKRFVHSCCEIKTSSAFWLFLYIHSDQQLIKVTWKQEQSQARELPVDLQNAWGWLKTRDPLSLKIIPNPTKRIFWRANRGCNAVHLCHEAAAWNGSDKNRANERFLTRLNRVRCVCVLKIAMFGLERAAEALACILSFN